MSDSLLRRWLASWWQRLIEASGTKEDKSKQFFFEKKNQKTFVSLGSAVVKRFVSAVRDSARKSFLLFCVEKEDAFFCSTIIQDTQRTGTSGSTLS